MGSLEEAVMSIPENLAGLSYSDPLGIEVGDLTDSNAVAEDQEVDASIFGNIKAKFASGNAAFAYLIFILLYTPCVAAMGAYVREFGHKFARFIAVWTMALAYLCATFYNQLTHFADSPITSGIWMAAIVAIFFGTYRVFKRVGKKQQGSSEAQVA
jgi:ferrous iron transport protein B